MYNKCFIIVFGTILALAFWSCVDAQVVWKKTELKSNYGYRSLTYATYPLLCPRSFFAQAVSIEGWFKKVNILQFWLNDPLSFMGWGFGPDLYLGYLQAQQGNLSAYSFRVIWRSLVEYQDIDGNGVYNPLTDPVLQNIPLWAIPWGTCLTFSNSQSIDNQTKIFTITSASNLPGGGQLTLDLVISTGVVSNGNTTLTPNVIKQDIGVYNFPWKGTNSSLAIQAYVVSKGVRAYKTSNNINNDGDPNSLDQITISGGAQVSGGFFSWDSKVYQGGKVSGAVVRINTSGLVEADNTSVNVAAGETIGAIFFTLASQPTNYIFWDPVVGANVAETDNQMLGIIVGTVGFFVIVVIIAILVVYFTLRKRNQYNPV